MNEKEHHDKVCIPQLGRACYEPKGLPYTVDGGSHYDGGVRVLHGCNKPDGSRPLFECKLCGLEVLHTPQGNRVWQEYLVEQAGAA